MKTFQLNETTFVRLLQNGSVEIFERIDGNGITLDFDSAAKLFDILEDNDYAFPFTNPDGH